jgi:hypothetical protein
VRNSIIALLSQAKQSIIGARFSPTNFTFVSSHRVLIDMIVRPATIVSVVPMPLLSIHSRALSVLLFPDAAVRLLLLAVVFQRIPRKSRCPICTFLYPLFLVW